MGLCRFLVAGALILNYFLTTSAAVLKVPVVETSALDGRSSDELPVGGFQAPATTNFKRSVIDSGRANVAYPGSLAPTKGNSRDVSPVSTTSYPELHMATAGGQRNYAEYSLPIGQGSISVISDARQVDAGKIVSASNKFESHERQPSDIRPTATGDFSHEISSLVGIGRPSTPRDIVTIGEKLTPEGTIHFEEGAEQSSESVLLQAAIKQVSQFIERAELTSGSGIAGVAVTENSTSSVTDRYATSFIGDMKNYYETVVNDTQVDGGTISIENDGGEAELGATNTENIGSVRIYSTSERVGDVPIEGATTVVPEMLSNEDAETKMPLETSINEMGPTEVEQVEVTTEVEDAVEITSAAEERSEVQKGASGRQLSGPGVHPDAEVLSDRDNEIDGRVEAGVEAGADAGDCSRPCVAGAPPRVCKYTFHVEWYHTMSKACFGCPGNASDCDRPHCVPADGVERPIIVVNRQMPGPTVSVCLHDVVQVDVVNGMTEETTSVHWHGQHQRASPHMDGVPFVTQCPIGPASAFRYRFVADTPGTHFWHSHTGCQRADGLYGALIVRTPAAADPHSRLYDEEGGVLQLADWGRPLGVDKFVNHHHAAGDNKPTAVLLNGRGGLHWALGRRGPPPASFSVKQGKRYRFRVINNGFLNCPIQLSVDGHSLLVISSDGADIKPVKAESLVTYAGERWDFVLEASAAPSSYWIRLRGLMDCGEQFTKAHQVAILQYQGSNLTRPAGNISWEDADRPGLSVNTLNVGPGTPDSLVMSELTAAGSQPDDASLAPEPDRTFYLGYDFYAIDNPHFHHPKYYGMSQVKDVDHRLFTPQFNHLSLRLPAFPLLSQFSDLDESTVCNETSMAGRGCEQGYCECLHMLRVPLGAVVEIVLVDAGNMYNANHPFHLHGHAFRVVAMGKLGTNTSVEEVRALDRAGGIRRKLRGAPVKDTVTVPDGGFTVLRVVADNPGYWLFHCHIEFHVEVGMAVVFKVGEHSDFPPAPPGFPRCSSWLPPYPTKGQSLARLTAPAPAPDALTDRGPRPSAAPAERAPLWAALLLALSVLAS